MLSFEVKLRAPFGVMGSASSWSRLALSVPSKLLGKAHRRWLMSNLLAQVLGLDRRINETGERLCECL
jgi:hypothetical protein